MAEDEPENLWLYGQMEPWRRGRIILLNITIFYAVLQALVFAATLLVGAIEVAMGFALTLVVWWLLSAFVWFGTHWVRWLLGAWGLGIGFADFIWGIRDQSVIVWSMGVLSLIVGAFCFAPSVHFFALRQRERIRWPEKLVVVAIFFILAGSCCLALVGMAAYRTLVQREAEDYGSSALQKIFAENDTVYLLGEASDEWLHQPAGNLAVTAPLTQKLLQLGDVENVRVTKTELHPVYKFPLTISYVGVIDGEGRGRCGAVWLRLAVTRSQTGWRINGFWWRCWNPTRY